MDHNGRHRGERQGPSVHRGDELKQPWCPRGEMGNTGSVHAHDANCESVRPELTGGRARDS